MNFRKSFSSVLQKSFLILFLCGVTIFSFPQNQAEGASQGDRTDAPYGNQGNVTPYHPQNPNRGLDHRYFIEPDWRRGYRVMVYIRMKAINPGSLNELRAAGVNITHISEQYKVVTGYVSSDRISRLNQLRSVLHVRLAEKPLLNQKPLKPLPGQGGTGGPITGPFHN